MPRNLPSLNFSRCAIAGGDAAQCFEKTYRKEPEKSNILLTKGIMS